MRRLALAALLLLSIPAIAGLSVYSKDITKWPQFNEMDKSRGIFTLTDDDQRQIPVSALTAGVVNYYLQLKFIYTTDGISDEWDSHYDAYRRGEYWKGDCDDFAFTAAEALVRDAGIPRENVFIVVVTSWLQGLVNQAHHRNDPRSSTPDHMMVLYYADRWRVISNGMDGTPKAEDVFGADFFPHSIINISNYGSGLPNHTAAGFVRFWFE